MLNEAAKKWLSDHFRESVKFNEPLSRHTSLQVGGPADVYVEPETLEKLVLLMNWARKNEIPHWIIGAGTNLLVKDAGVRGIVVALSRCLNRIGPAVQQHDVVLVNAMAGVKLQTLCWYAVKRGLAGLNFALGIPGTVGGAVVMNAGTSLGCIGDVIEAVSVLQPDGTRKEIGRERLEFSYRRLSLKDGDSIPQPVILHARFALLRGDAQTLRKEAKSILDSRKQRQPAGYPGAGCFFRNPSSDQPAGWLIDQAGLKGRMIGGAQISPKHANFIVNRGGASAADILALVSLIREKVKTQFDVDLQLEVRVLGS